jgi:hypothetical protein
MSAAIVLSAINTVCLVVVIIVIAFFYIELNRFKRAEDDIVYYLNRATSKPPAPTPAPTPATK